jgi:DNA-binding transcriptional LysR family regulator
VKKTDPYSIDFAALRTLRAVYECRSFSLAAERLDLGQSTISYTIDRLRTVFGDPLFVRQGSGIVATDRCISIVGAAGGMLEEFTGLIEPPVFDPATSTASVSIASNYYERATLLPLLLKTLRQKAPGIHLNMVQSLTEGEQSLRRGDSDILLSPMTIKESGFFKRSLFTDHYVCIMCKQNPLASQTMTEQRYVNANHALVTYGDNWRSFYLVELEGKGLELNRSISIPSPADIGMLLAGTDMISTVPSRIADKLSGDIISVACPFPAPFNLDMYWTSRTHESAMLVWLRKQIARNAAELASQQQTSI